MNRHHQTALANHCRFAFETCQPRFCFRDLEGRCSVIITVNSGWE